MKTGAIFTLLDSVETKKKGALYALPYHLCVTTYATFFSLSLMTELFTP